MEIFSFEVSAGRAVDAYGSVGLTAQKLVRGEAVHVTVLHVAAGGRVGRHPAPVDQLFIVTAGRGAVQAGDGDWQPVGAGQAVVWRAGAEHATRADEDITAVVVEMEDMPLARTVA
ncbi:cupin domain-containing protein [Actinoplanes sp. NPDC026619]|uniref:cupin domain-containing protein n=1 Tax=Actinoplanes sp. NPDC026619 TaxID=3155798 RepID=UPI0033C52AF7